MIYLIAPLITSILFLLLGTFVFLKNNKSAENRIFSLLCLITFGWQFSWFILFGFTPDIYSDLVIRVGYTFIIFIPIVYFNFWIYFFNSQPDRILMKISYLAGAVFTAMLWSSQLIIAGSYNFFWGKYPKAGPAHPIYLFVLMALFLRGLILLKKSMRERNSISKMNQTKYVFLALLFYIFAVCDFASNYGIEIYPMGFAFIGVSLSVVAYAIARHQLLDIEVVVRRTAVFAGLFAFVYGVFTAVTVIGQVFFQNNLHWNQWVAMIPTVIVITFSLRPMENFLTNATDRFLFQKKYDYRDLLRTFTNEVLTVLDLQKLTEQTVAGLMKIIKLESACILLMNTDTKKYQMIASSGIKNKEVVFDASDTLIEYLKHSHQPIIKDKSVDSMDGYSTLKDDFKKVNAQLCLPIALHDELTGVLCLGMKKSGEEFTPEDIDILMTLARTEAIALANAQLFDQLSKTQAEAAQREKMAVIGTLAAGINHEICNPLGIVRGQCEMFLLNLRDGIYNSKNREDMCQIATDIMNKVIKETDRATGITKKLSGFAKPAKKTESEEVFVEKEADEVLGLIGHDLKLNNIEFSKKFIPGFPPIFADKRQIQEVLFNIIRNAAQAMDKKDGRIELSGTSANGTAIIKISDNGSGIPADKIGQIFNPFFTTKEPGKGTGLGLFIVRQVIERNNGTIAVDSEEGKGTTFTLSFPAAQPAKALAA